MSPLSLWWRLVREHGGVQPRYCPRFAGILATSCAAAPLRLAERLRYGAAVARTEIRPPVFIQGYARSGTTHLHNLMAMSATHSSEVAELHDDPRPCLYVIMSVQNWTKLRTCATLRDDEGRAP